MLHVIHGNAVNHCNTVILPEKAGGENRKSENSKSRRPLPLHTKEREQFGQIQRKIENQRSYVLLSTLIFASFFFFFLTCRFSQAQGEEMGKVFLFPLPIIMVSTVVVKLRATCEPITPTVVKTEGM